MRNAAAREVERAELALEENNKNMASNIYSLADSLRLIAQNIFAKQINIQRARRAFDVAQEGYNVGLRNILEVRDAQNQLDDAQLDFLNERFNYITAQIDLTSQLGVGLDVLRRYAQQ